MVKRSNHACIFKQTINKHIIYILFGGFVERRADQTAAERFSPHTCCWLHVFTSSIDKEAFFTEDTESSVRNLLCVALWGKGEG